MVDKAKIEQAVRLLLEGIGEDIDTGRSALILLTGLPACVKKFTEVLVMKRISIC